MTKIIIILIPLLITYLLYKNAKKPFWSVVFSMVVNVTLFSWVVHINFMPLPDREVTQAFNQASGNTVVLSSFTVKWMDKYLVILQVSKETKEMLELLQAKGK